MGSCVIDAEFQFCKMERVLEMDGWDDGCHDVKVLNVTELCTLIINFVAYSLP